MLSGFNTNVRHRGVLFHVQTEDSGTANPHVITHLFHGGNIMASEKRDYSEHLASSDLERFVKELMEEQHKAMLRRLKNGECDAEIETRVGPRVFGDSSDTAATVPPPPVDEVTEATSPLSGPPDAAPEAPRSFGERVVSAKPLDEVVLDYLVENARKRKRPTS